MLDGASTERQAVVGPTLDPKHWHERAKNARAVAEWMKNGEAKRLLLEVAERYERIAELALSGETTFVMPDHEKE
jgi:hypothetical protein